MRYRRKSMFHKYFYLFLNTIELFDFKTFFRKTSLEIQNRIRITF